MMHSALLAASLASAATPDTAPPVVGHIPLCAGLSIVTGISQKDGDYESIKTIESITPQAIRLKYSSEHMTQDIFSTDPPKLEKLTVYRQVLLSDQASARSYLQQYSQNLPEQIPGTTALGASSLILKALKSQRPVEFGFFQATSGDAMIPASRGTHPNVYDYQMMASIHRVEATPVMLPVIVNDVPVMLPTVHAAGTYYGDRTEFYFLDDPDNPLTLRLRFGIDALATPGPPPAKRDRDDLQVIKITYSCADAPAVNTIEQQLSATGKAEIYDIYFSVNSDQIREESEPSLKAIVDALNHHANWKLAVNGHTDHVGADAYNLTLSQKRAEAVKVALVARFHIDAARLTTDGFGASQPQDSNATLEGRAHNRRVELIRQ
jgi:outer membrane protein OmpA-like peptidoglycan-associated protein